MFKFLDNSLLEFIVNDVANAQLAGYTHSSVEVTDGVVEVTLYHRRNQNKTFWGFPRDIGSGITYARHNEEYVS